MSEAAEALGTAKEETVIFSNQNGHTELQQQDESQPTWYELRHGKLALLHMQKQRCRSAVQ